MAQLDGGGGGGGDVGDTTNVADDTNIDGGGREAVDPPQDVEIDRQTERRLRRDAQSDPMAEQTEPAPSPEGTSATVDSGTDDGGTAAATPDDSAPATDQGNIDASNIEEPESTPDATQDTGPTPDDAAEPADTGDTAASGGSDGPQPVSGTGPEQTSPMEPAEAADSGTRDSRDQTTARPTTGTPGGEADRPAPSDLSEPERTAPQQGIEESGATPEVEQQAQEFEQQVLEENPWLSEEDVAVQLVGTDEGVRFQVELTESAEDRVSARRQDVVEGLGIGAGSLASTGGTDPAADEQAEARGETQDALEGIGFFDEQAEREAEQREALREQVEEDIEGQVGAGRAERAGITNPTLREGVVENTDLEAGEDFTIDIRQTPGGGISIDAELTEEFRQEEAERAIQRALQEETGVRLDPGEEFRVVEGDEGGYQPVITEEGERTIREEQPEQFGDFDWSFGMGDPERDEVEAALGDASAAISGSGRDFASALFDEGGVASESLGEEVLRAAGRPDLGRQYEEGLREFGRGVAQAPFALGNVPALGGAVLEGVEYAGYTTQQDLGTTAVETRDRAGEIGSAVYGEITERPAEFAGLGVGTLFASYGIMRAAANVGPRTGLATRYAIQPGEELAGSVGFRATQRVAGTRRAQQLFPNREPLIFSEEFAIRQARRLREGAGPRASAARARATDLLLGEPETRVNLQPGRFDPVQQTTERPGVLSQARRGVSRVEDAFTGRTFAGVPVPRTRAETETTTRPSTEAETEALMDELEGPLRRMEEARIREAERSDPIRQRGNQPTRRYRPRPTEPEVTARGRTALETDTGALRRLEIAGQPTTENVSTALSTEVASQELVSQAPLSLEAETGRSDVLSEVETEQEQMQELRLELGIESETELEQRLELEAEAEAETELEFETETETRTELEPFGGRSEREDEEELAGQFDESRELLERDLLNPLTGR